MQSLARLAPWLVFVAVYLPAAGHGFIADDFGWILHHRISGATDVVRILLQDNGFYRPVVGLSFGLNHAAFGVDPRPYGIVNVALALTCAALVWALGRSVGLARDSALCAAALWMLNFHGINMAILWISGRTALFLVAGASASAVALMRNKPTLAGLCYAIALFSKEEAIALPLVLTVWLLVVQRAEGHSRVSAIRWLAMSGVVSLAYLLVRSTTGAMTPTNAPPYYRLTTEPFLLLRNVLEYSDRAMTLSAIVVVLALLLLGMPSRPLDRRTRAQITCGFVWLIGGFAITLFVPVRSSLYACFPSVGVCIAAAATIEHLWRHASDASKRRATVAAAVVPFLVGPVLLSRTHRWVSIAEFSSAALTSLTRHAQPLPDGSDIVVRDDRRVRANMASAFGTLVHEAVQVHTGRHLRVWIEPPVANADAAELQPPCGACVELTLEVRDGQLVPAGAKE